MIPDGFCVDDEPWLADALCVLEAVSAEVFYPERGESVRPAQDVCRRCKVRGDCLEYALRANEKFGVWGGASERERRRIRRRRNAAVAA